MEGFIVKHDQFGWGKVLELPPGQVIVGFFKPKGKLQLARSGTRLPVKRSKLPLDSFCSSKDGDCHIVEFLSGGGTEPYSYRVEFDSGLEQEVSECDLYLKEIKLPDTVLGRMSELHIESFDKFRAREVLLEQYSYNLRNAQGLNALLSSRIDLRPHQAYVAGTVLMDRAQRFILADEVGLGKTIEAGIVIHDLLESKPSAKILIICPNTLTQQWLCELYSKFSGQIFTLLDLHSVSSIGRVSERMIVSYTGALSHSSNILNSAWDLVVVDEAHHLLNIITLYELVQSIASKAPGCLLLSAIPAQHREDEYFRLLALLEPDRYNPNDKSEKVLFRKLYARQIEVGRKLNYLTRQIAKYKQSGGDPKRILSKINELVQLEVLSADKTLADSVEKLDADLDTFVEDARSLIHHVGDRYRISRRILRNRRSQLLEVEPDLDIKRELNVLSYKMGAYEYDVTASIRSFLEELKTRGLKDSILVPLAKFLFQGLSDPQVLHDFINLRTNSSGGKFTVSAFDQFVNYQVWEDYVETLWSSIDVDFPEEEFTELESNVEDWKDSEEASTGRLNSLVEFLSESHGRDLTKKFVVFAGFHSLAPYLLGKLERQFGKEAVALFSWELQDSRKEREVIRFRKDRDCWLLVTDETGGEGRNFQFADEIIHYDLPWHVSKIEQRIGRLDRLGRILPVVRSNVLCPENSEEYGFIKCLEDGFEIFNQSISGLEFALSHLESEMVTVAVSEGYEGLIQLIEKISDKAVNERSDDDMQSLLDAASMDRASAEVYKGAQTSTKRDERLEKAFCNYIRAIGGRGAIRFISADDYPDGIIRFRPALMADDSIKFPLDADGNLVERDGTFRRDIAQERPDLEFFSVGNEFYRSVCSSMFHLAKNRVYAIECTWPNGRWLGFEFAYRIVVKSEVLSLYPGLIKHLSRVLSVKMVHCFVGENKDVLSEKQGQDVLTIRNESWRKSAGEGPGWCDMGANNEKLELLTQRYTDWSALFTESENIARGEVKKRLDGQLLEAIKIEKTRIDEQVRQATLSKSDDWEDEVRGYELLKEAIDNWGLELDFAGFLSINGRVTI